jgi:hypothetical protein
MIKPRMICWVSVGPLRAAAGASIVAEDIAGFYPEML